MENVTFEQGSHYVASSDHMVAAINSPDIITCQRYLFDACFNARMSLSFERISTEGNLHVSINVQ